MAHKLQPERSSAIATLQQCDSEVKRICDSAAFQRAPVMRRLLQFLVAETRAGRGNDLKAYGVAVDGLGKGPDFDPQADSYPRVQVGRLRRMIENFYQEEGDSEDGVRLSIPSGSYRVDWVCATQANIAPPAVADGPADSLMADGSADRKWLMLLVGIVAVAVAGLFFVMHFAPTEAPPPRTPATATQQASVLVPPPVMDVETVATVEGADKVLAQRIDRILGDALHRTWVFNARALGTPVPPDGDAVSDYRLTGTLVGAERKLLYLTIWDRRQMTQIWSRRLELAHVDSFVDALGPSINAIMSPFGVIGSRERRALAGNFSPGFPCMMRYSQYYIENTAALAAPVQACLDLTLKHDPGDAPALAAKMMTRIREAAGHPDEVAKVSSEALVLARRAMDADPYSADASMAMALAAYLNNMCDLGNASAAEALERNPYDSYAYARAGLYMFQCGDAHYEDKLRRAWELDNTLPAVTAMPILIGMSERGEGEAALRFALRIPVAEGYRKAPYELTMAVAYAAANDQKAARDHWALAARTVPAPADAGPAFILKRILMLPRLTERTERFLRQQGLFT